MLVIVSWCVKVGEGATGGVAVVTRTHVRTMSTLQDLLHLASEAPVTSEAHVQESSGSNLSQQLEEARASITRLQAQLEEQQASRSTTMQSMQAQVCGLCGFRFVKLCAYHA